MNKTEWPSFTYTELKKAMEMVAKETIFWCVSFRTIMGHERGEYMFGKIRKQLRDYNFFTYTFRFVLDRCNLNGICLVAPFE